VTKEEGSSSMISALKEELQSAKEEIR